MSDRNGSNRGNFKAQRCPHCRHRFKTKTSWQNHRKNVPHDTPHHCKECKQFFIDAIDLKHHLNSVHQQGPFVKQNCSKCGTVRPRSRLNSSGVCCACVKHEKRLKAMVDIFGTEEVHVGQFKQLAQESTEAFTGVSTSNERRYLKFRMKANVERSSLSTEECQKKYEDTWLDIKYKLLGFFKQAKRCPGHFDNVNNTLTSLQNRFGCDCRTFRKEQVLVEREMLMTETVHIGSSWGFLANKLLLNQPPDKNILYTDIFNKAVSSDFAKSSKRKLPVFEDESAVDVIGPADAKITELPEVPLHKIARVASAVDVTTIPRLRRTCKEFSNVFQQYFQATEADILKVYSLEQEQEQDKEQQQIQAFNSEAELQLPRTPVDESQIGLYKEVSKQHQMLFFVEHCLHLDPILRIDEIIDIQIENRIPQTHKCALYFPHSLSLFPKEQIFQVTGNSVQNSIFHVCHEVCQLMVKVFPEVFEVEMLK